MAWFSIDSKRNCHSFQTVARIRGITQVLLDLHHDRENFCVHPLKVWNRQSPTMFSLHLRQGNRYVPVSNSVDAARLLMDMMAQKKEQATQSLDYWDRLFLEAERIVGEPSNQAEAIRMVDQLSGS